MFLYMMAFKVFLSFYLLFTYYRGYTSLIKISRAPGSGSLRGLLKLEYPHPGTPICRPEGFKVVL